jgi:hypothetical protein
MHSVTFRILPPGKLVTFMDHFSLGNLQSRRYLVYLWIPSPDPAAQLGVSQLLLLNHTGASEKQTGLYTIAASSCSPLNIFTKAPLDRPLHKSRICKLSCLFARN